MCNLWWNTANKYTDFTIDFKGIVGLKVPWSHLTQDGEHVQEVVQRHVALSVLGEDLSDPLAKGVVLQGGHRGHRALPNTHYSVATNWISRPLWACRSPHLQCFWPNSPFPPDTPAMATSAHDFAKGAIFIIDPFPTSVPWGTHRHSSSLKESGNI